jgi:hypothetical protein
VQRVPQTIPDDAEAHHKAQNRQARKGADPPPIQLVPAARDHRTPLRDLRRRPEPEEAQRRERRDGMADVQRPQDDDGRQGVDQNVPEEDAERGRARCACRLDVLAPSGGQDEAPGEACVGRPRQWAQPSRPVGRTGACGRYRVMIACSSSSGSAGTVPLNPVIVSAAVSALRIASSTASATPSK